MTSDTSHRVWRSHLPFHLFFAVLALIGYFKAGTLAGLWLLGASLALTALVDAFARGKARID